MAKKSVIRRNKKRISLVERCAKKRSTLVSMVKDCSLPIHERLNARKNLLSMPRDSSKSRIRVRCSITGRGRGNISKFSLSRMIFREFASVGYIPGVVKSSL